MFLRIDRLQIELPQPKEPSPESAAAVQELLGGRFGEMSTLMNYMYQSFNFRGRDKVRPFYDLIANIATEEMGHIELVAATINLMLTGFTKPADPTAAPLASGVSARNTHHFIATGQTALCGDSMGGSWRGDYVFSSGNLKLDLLHNFFLEVGARTQKIRVYGMPKNPVAREMVGYLLVRGGVHATAYALALEKLTGVTVTKLLPIPEIDNKLFPEARKYEEKGFDRILYRFSPTTTRNSARSGRVQTRRATVSFRCRTARRPEALFRCCRRWPNPSRPPPIWRSYRKWPRNCSASAAFAGERLACPDCPSTGERRRSPCHLRGPSCESTYSAASRRSACRWTKCSPSSESQRIWEPSPQSGCASTYSLLVRSAWARAYSSITHCAGAGCPCPGRPGSWNGTRQTASWTCSCKDHTASGNTPTSSNPSRAGLWYATW